MAGYIIVFSFIVVAIDAIFTDYWKKDWGESSQDWVKNSQDWVKSSHQLDIFDDSFEIFEPPLSCDLTIKQNGYVIDDLATAYGGDSVSLICSARCKGRGATPALGWYKGSSRKAIPSTRRRVSSYSRSSGREQRLAITWFLKRDVGLYTCKGWLGPTIGWTKKTIRLQMGCMHPMISCDVSRCLPSRYRCDGVRQCSDGFDEYGCGADQCDEDEFFCDAKCFDLEKKCDGIFDCYDGGDEEDCEEGRTTTDIYDYEDENTTESSTTAVTTISTAKETTSTSTSTTTLHPDCDGDLFLCQDGDCIPASWECDGAADCPLGDDEWDCWEHNDTTTVPPSTPENPSTTTTIQYQDCEGDLFACWDGNCIPSEWVCDHFKDCSQGEDELNCGTVSTSPTVTTLPTVPIDSDCPEKVRRSGHYYDVFKGTCYAFVDTEDYWNNANTYCKEMGGDLVIIRNAETMEYIKRKLNSDKLNWYNNGVWNGATHMNRSQWEWSTGESLNFTYWAEDEPKNVLLSFENCVCMRREHDWRWGSYPCHRPLYKYKFICQFSTSAVTTPIITNTFSTAKPKTSESTAQVTTVITVQTTVETTRQEATSMESTPNWQTTESTPASTITAESTTTETTDTTANTETEATSAESTRKPTIVTTATPTTARTNKLTTGESTANPTTAERSTNETTATTLKSTSETTEKEVCAGQFDCGGGECIALNQVCDSFPNCADERDEKNCRSKVCQESQRMCDDGETCINASHWCDGRNDCPDSSDELKCN